MAERRMFAKTIIDSDAFLDMPASTQSLYFHLGMRADDDGFINNPKKISRMIAASDDDLKILIAKNFIIPFDNGIVVIKHWRIHNLIQKDRYKETVYIEQRDQLSLKENKSYTIGNRLDTDCIHDVSKVEPQVSIGKVSIGKDSLEREGTEVPQQPTTKALNNSSKRFIKPTLEELSEYCEERSNTVDPQRFLDYYEANGWRVGKNPMKDWKAAIRTWEKNEIPRQSASQPMSYQDQAAARRQASYEEAMKAVGVAP